MPLGMNGREIKRNSTALKGIESIALTAPPGQNSAKLRPQRFSREKLESSFPGTPAFMADLYGRLIGKAGV